MKKKIKVGIIGCGKIAIEHSIIVRALGHIIYGCYTKDFFSKNWKSYSRIFPNVKKYNKLENFINDTEINFIICSASWDVIPKILPVLLKSNKKMLIEKPIAFSSESLKRNINLHKKNMQNKFVGYNRRFYSTTQKLYKRIVAGGLISADVKITENFNDAINKYGRKIKKYIHYVSSTSHIIDLCLYIFGELKLEYSKIIKSKKNNFYNFFGNYVNKDKKLIQISIINGNPTKTGITCYFDDGSTWILSPIEILKIYNKYKIHEYSKKRKIRVYEPNLVDKNIVSLKYKPGFYEQLKIILEGSKKNLKVVANVHNSLNLLEFFENTKK